MARSGVLTMTKLNFKILSINIINKKLSLKEVETKEQIKNAHKTDVYKHFKKEFKEMEGQKLK